MNAPRVPKVRMKVEEFLVWSERQPDYRYELVDGEIVAMTRDTVRHNLTKFAACRALDDAVRAAGLSCAVFIDGVGATINDQTLLACNDDACGASGLASRLTVPVLYYLHARRHEKKTEKSMVAV